MSDVWGARGELGTYARYTLERYGAIEGEPASKLSDIPPEFGERLGLTSFARP